VYDVRVITKIRKLLQQGYKQRVIARMVGVSSSLVRAVSIGKRQDQHQNKGQPRPGRIFGKLGICPVHGKIKLPCLACAALDYRRRHTEIDWSQSDPLPNDDERIRRMILVQHRELNHIDDKITQGYE
jgi:hypothetical protein